ncbi:MAG: hypothetical protein IJC15_03265 [Clostridia bacterium]|nr:hypothetical protein [Clostridia bacterium]
MKKCMAGLLLLAMLLPLIACGGDAPAADTTAAAAVTTAAPETEAPETEPPLTDNLPDVNLDGYEMTILNPSVSSFGWALITIDPIESTGEVLNDAIYARNSRIEERFNCKIVELTQDAAGQTVLTNDVLSNNNTFKLAQIYDSQVKTVLNAGVIQPWNDVPYVNLDAEWWNQSAADTFTVSGKVFGAVGDFNLSEYSKAYMIYFNKDIYKSIPQEKSLYDYVLDGTWTLERMTTLAQQYARDLNGDTVMNDQDQWGIVGTAKVLMQALVSGAGVRFIEPDADGTPVFSASKQGYMEKMENIISRFSASEGWYYQNPSPMGAMFDEMFVAGKTLFQAASIWNADAYRVIEQDIGMLPAPKYDENQENYQCITAAGLISCLPKSLPVDELEKVGLICEALAFDSRQNVLPIYKETVLKGKYARDPESTKIIDIIFDAACFDAGVLMWYSLRETYMSGPFFKLDNTLASTTKLAERVANSEIKQTLKAVEKAS